MRSPRTCTRCGVVFVPESHAARCSGCRKWWKSRQKSRTRTCAQCGAIVCIIPTASGGHIKRSTCSDKCQSMFHAKQSISNGANLLLIQRDAHGWEKTIGRPQTKEGNALGIKNRMAKEFILRTPRGEVYALKNLREFVRTHEHLFEETDTIWRPGARSKLTGERATAKGRVWCRASSGLGGVTAGRSGTWKGWTLVLNGGREAAIIRCEHELKGMAATYQH